MKTDSSIALGLAAPRFALTSRGFLLFYAVFLGLIIAAVQPHCSNTWSRLATAQSLVARGTLAIDDDPSTPDNVDKVFAHGSYYSDKPPALALMAAAVYYPLYHVGIKLEPRRDLLDPTRNLAYGLITYILIGGSTLLALAAFNGALVLVGLNQSGRLLMSAGLALATLMLTWSTTLNNHVFSASWIFISFYLLLKAKAGPNASGVVLMPLAGFAVGLAAAADSACALFVVGFAFYILFSRRSGSTGLSGAVLYLCAAGLMMLPGIIISYNITGDFRPMSVHQELFRYPGSYWNRDFDHLSGIEPNRLRFAVRYALKCLIGPNGFLLYNPLLLIALYQAALLVAHRRPLWPEALLVLTLSILFAGYFFLYTSNFGGGSYSIRWFVTLIPLLWFFAFPFFEDWTPARKWTYSALCAYSFALAILGSLNQWPLALEHPRTPVFVLNWRTSVVPRVDRLAHMLYPAK